MKKNYKSVKLSSKWTKVGYYGTVAGAIFALFFTLYTSYALIQSFQLNILLAWVIGAGLLVFCVFAMQNLAEGNITENVFHLKKFNKVEKTYNLNQLIKVKVYENRKEKYILATFDNGTGPEKYLFANTKLFYAGEQRNTENILKEILEENKKAIA